MTKGKVLNFKQENKKYNFTFTQEEISAIAVGLSNIIDLGEEELKEFPAVKNLSKQEKEDVETIKEVVGYSYAALEKIEDVMLKNTSKFEE